MRNKINNKINLFLVIAMLVFTSCTALKENNNLSQNSVNIEQTDNINNINYEKTGDLEKYFGSNTDPWESFNRRVYYFNYTADKYALMPIVRTYKYITPVFVQNRVTNFFRNLKGISITANSAAQFKGRKAMRALARFAINTVFGIGGMFDVASKMGMPKPYEDFGLTLAHYGVPRGPYLILPLFGPSYLRDAFGLGVETAVIRGGDPYRNMELFSVNSIPATALNGIDKRTNVKFEYYGTNSPFEYEYIRFLWNRYRTLQEETGVQFF